jgi:hypothetical protein
MLKKDNADYQIIVSNNVEWVVLKKGEVEPYLFSCGSIGSD